VEPGKFRALRRAEIEQLKRAVGCK
jgi:hypothetical protein